MVTRWSSRLTLLALVLLLAAVGGCKGKKDTPINPDLVGGTSGTGPEQTSGESMQELELEKLLFSKDKGLKPVYFDYDSYALRPDALTALSGNAELIKKVPNVIIQIEGHCDERGTQEYNLALGEKRALATREHLMKLGISGDRMITISYGEENPAVDGHDESAWKFNRRSEFNKAM